MSEYNEQEDRNDETFARGDGQLSQYPHSGTDLMPFKGRMSLVINGMIESGLIPDENGVCIKFDFKAGRDWSYDFGVTSGISQHAYKSMQTNDRVVWNFPFEMVYSAHDITGWPMICLTLTARDFRGRDVICGYGVMHVPT